MKNIIIVLLFVLMSITSFAQKVINNPSVEASLTGIFYINKIELFENETKLEVQSKFLPNWYVHFPARIFIKDSDTGKKYSIIKVEGVEFDEKVYMPESGEQTFTLIFPPIDKTVKKIDYSDMIFGVSLTESKKLQKSNDIPVFVNNWIKEELDKNRNEPITDYNAPEFFNRKEGKLVGYIKGYDTRLGFETGIIYMDNSITREEYPVVIQIYPDGRFEGIVPLIHPTYTYLVFSKKPVRLYLEPNQTLSMILDWNEFLMADRLKNQNYQIRNIEFRGNLAVINKDLNSFQPEVDYDYKSFKEKVKTLTPQEFISQEERVYNKIVEQINSYISTNEISKNAKLILQNETKLNYSIHLLDFLRRRDYESKKDTLNKILKVKETNSYYDFLHEMPLNDNALLVSNRFKTFINRFEYSSPFKVRYAKGDGIVKPEISFSEYLEKKNIQITDKDKVLLKSEAAKKIKSNEEYKKFMEPFSDAYKEGLKGYTKKYVMPLHKEKIRKQEISTVEWRLKDSVLENTFGLEKSLAYNITKVRALNFEIKNKSREQALKYWDVLKVDLNNDFLMDEGMRVINEMYPVYGQSLKGIESSGVSQSDAIKEKSYVLPEGRATDVFNKIMEPFKGKIVFVDFWATTCAPCVAGIERMKPTRKKYKGNADFDFVFITDERSSPKKPYDTFVKEQELMNVNRLTVDDYNYLRQLFKFNGIPQYVVVGKNGEIIDNDFPMHNFSFLLDDILEANK